MFNLYGKNFNSRLILGTAGYPSPQHLVDSVKASGSEIVTVSLRRASGDLVDNRFFELIKEAGLTVLPNTAGCLSAKEAINTAKMCREIFQTNWIKLEVIGDDYTLQPDPVALYEASCELLADGFEVFPYMSDDLALANRLADAGCQVLMPWAAPIGSGQGIINRQNLEILRERHPQVTLIVDAGIGAPSHAAEVMELGYDGVILNTAVAKAIDPPQMARAFALAVESGLLAHQAGLIPAQPFATASTAVTGRPFWHQG